MSPVMLTEYLHSDYMCDGQYNIMWKPGNTNVAYFFTKPLPRHQYDLMLNILLQVDHSQDNVSKQKKQESTVNYWTNHLNFKPNPEGVLESLIPLS